MLRSADLRFSSSAVSRFALSVVFLVFRVPFPSLSSPLGGGDPLHSIPSQPLSGHCFAMTPFVRSDALRDQGVSFSDSYVLLNDLPVDKMNFAN
jgi:hypothetical protein